MGIQGLLPFLKKIHEPINVSKFAGCTVAIDAYCWLHKGAFSCAEKLALGEKTDQYVYYCMKFINMLLAKNIKPIMVFDGCHLPSKKNVEKTRREKRELNKKKAAQFLREGKRAEARDCLQRCIDITPEMALELMNVCREKGVDCIVAPYEADAQLAYLNKIGVAQVIITEDSDLLLFGCEKVVFKMDHSGNGMLIEKDRLNEVTDIQTAHYSFEKFRHMCILSGCDYLQSLPGIGLARANKVFKIARQGEITQLLKKLSTYLKTSITVPQEYIDGFIAADNTFLHQFVFDPLQRKLVPLNPYPADINPDELSYAGSFIQAKKAMQIALGNINIYTGEVFSDFDPDSFVPKYVKKKPDIPHMLSIWNTNYRIKPKVVLKETQPQERPNLKGKEVHITRNLKKTSPLKRIREVEDGKDVISDNELHKMYASPVKKKLKIGEIDEDLHRFMFASKQDVKDEDEEKSNEVPSLIHSKSCPKFFNSLSHAHPEVKDNLTGTDNDDEKENGIVSPRRNIFACKSPSKKHRFNLNAAKQTGTKSRFFGSGTEQDSVKSIQKTAPKQIQIAELRVDEYKPIHSNYANVYTEPSQNLSDSKDEKNGSGNIGLQCQMETDLVASVTVTELPSAQCLMLSKSESVRSISPLPSPAGGSAFNWSKFKFNKQNSSESLSQRTLSSKIKTLRKPFKKVVSESNIESLFKKTSQGDSFNCKSDHFNTSADNNNKGVISVDIDINEKDTLSQSSSVDSFPYSIDSDCMQNSDFITSSQISQSSSQESSISTLSVRNSILAGDNSTEQQTSSGVYSLNDDTSQISAENYSQNSLVDDEVILIDSWADTRSSGYFKPEELNINKSPTMGNRMVSEKGKVKNGCRVSGLSRKTKRNVKNTPDEKQKSLKDMFSKFAHKSSDKSGLKHECSLENSTQDSSYTPEGRTSILGKRIKDNKSFIL